MVLAFSSVSRSSLIGVAIACSGNVLISLALTVQKLAHRRQHEELAASRSSPASRSPGGSSPSTPQDETGISELANAPASSEGSPKRLAVPVLLVDPGSPSIPQTPERGSDRVTAIPLEVDLSRTPSRTLDIVHENRAFGQNTQDVQRTSARGRQGNHGSKSNGVDHQSDNDHDGGEREDSEGDKNQEVEEGAYLKSKLWWLGMSLIAVGEGGNFLSYGFAPASVVAPLGTVALIANCIFAPLILKETFHLKELIGMALAILGAVTVVWSSNASNPRLDPNGLIMAIKQIPFIVYTSLNIFFVIILLLLSQSQKYGPKYIAIDVGVCALFGGYTVLSTKALSSLLSTIFVGAFKYWITWVLVAVLVTTSILQVKYLNRALMRFQSKEVIPTQFVFFSLAAIIGSAVLYQEFRDISFSQTVNFAFGIATTFLGVHLLTSFSEPDNDEDDQNSHTRPPAGPQRARSSASLNLLLPSTSRLSERAPLLIPITNADTPIVSTTGVFPGSGSLKGRLAKRTSTGDFSPHLGLSSQASFLLMATTPPSNSPISPATRRDRSASRSQVPQLDDERQNHV